MRLKEKTILFSLDHPVGITVAMVVITFLMAALVPFKGIKIDTDPENMLSRDNAQRVFHRITKKEFSLSDILVLGIVNDKDPDGVFNPESLKRVKELTDLAKILPVNKVVDKETTTGQPGGAGQSVLKQPAAGSGNQSGSWIVKKDIIAPSTVDNISQGKQGELIFSYLMKKVPETREEARKIRDAARHHPLLYGTLLSEDEKALCLYVPLTSKDKAYKVAEAFRAKIATFKGPEKYFITGLPVAEDQFGIEMFIQMAISAPSAMLLIFILMFIFFRKLILIISPMIIAMVSVISAMGLLISMGYSVHIMSSMIPIFLMPIAVVDSVHILSEFFDRYQSIGNKRETCKQVLSTLFMPMLYTSLTSAAGFASLALTPIPPVQVFGIFVAFGILVAWVWTIVFVPAYVMFIPEKSLKNFGMSKTESGEDHNTFMSRILFLLGRFTYDKLGVSLIIGITVIVLVLSGIGISKIRVNDNPVKWFKKSHEIRIADRVLNKHFGGTYEAYLILGKETAGTTSDLKTQISEKASEFETLINKIAKDKAPGNSASKTEKKAFTDTVLLLKNTIKKVAGDPAVVTYIDFMHQLKKAIQQQMFEADFDTSDVLDTFWTNGLDNKFQEMELFKRPAVLRYVGKLQHALLKTGIVGKSNSVVDLVKKINQELHGGGDDQYKIPGDKTDKARGRRMVADCLMQVQNSHKPDDLWHLVTQDYTKANVWIQLKSGDNRDMEKVILAVDNFFKKNPPSKAIGVNIRHEWAGLTFLNVAWQNKMVNGMFQSFIGSFLVVFLLMVVLFRSILWGLLSMIPLSVTIAAIYGVIGWIGKAYDMPVAVLSALTLGIAVDFAIHFLERSRSAIKKFGTWEKTVGPMFGEPARAITRNIIVIAIGFTPLLFAPLVPYQTVGIFLASIMALSGIATIFILPAAIRLLQKRLFTAGVAMKASCNCGLCIISSIVLVLVIAINIHQYALVKWTNLAWLSLIEIPVLVLICGIMSRRQACRIGAGNDPDNKPETTE